MLPKHLLSQQCKDRLGNSGCQLFKANGSRHSTPNETLRAGFPTGCDNANLSTYFGGSLAGSKVSRVGLIIFKGILEEEFEQRLFGGKIMWGTGGKMRGSSKRRRAAQRSTGEARLGCLDAVRN